MVTAPTNRSTAVLSITDDDQGGTVAFAAASFSVLENAGPATISVKRTLGTASGVTVHYATSNGTATAPSDYMSKSGTLTFAPGQQTATVTVDVNGDTTDEPDETFFVDLSDASGAAIGDGRGVGTIVDDDGTPSLSIDNVSVLEGDSGTTNAVFTVRMAPPSPQPASVRFATDDATLCASE